MKTDVVAYFDELFADLKDEEDTLTKHLEAMDAIHTQISQTVSSRSGIARVPFLTPVDFDFGDVTPETIYIDKYDGQIDMMLTKLINISNFICDMSTTYRKYSLGAFYRHVAQQMALQYYHIGLA